MARAAVRPERSARGGPPAAVLPEVPGEVRLPDHGRAQEHDELRLVLDPVAVPERGPDPGQPGEEGDPRRVLARFLPHESPEHRHLPASKAQHRLDLADRDLRDPAHHPGGRELRVRIDHEPALAGDGGADLKDDFVVGRDRRGHEEDDPDRNRVQLGLDVAFDRRLVRFDPDLGGEEHPVLGDLDDCGLVVEDHDERSGEHVHVPEFAEEPDGQRKVGDGEAGERRGAEVAAEEAGVDRGVAEDAREVDPAPETVVELDLDDRRLDEDLAACAREDAIEEERHLAMTGGARPHRDEAGLAVTDHPRDPVRGLAENRPHRLYQRVPEPVFAPGLHTRGGAVLLAGRRPDPAPDPGSDLVYRLGLAGEGDVVDRVDPKGRLVAAGDEGSGLDLDAQIRLPGDAFEQAGEWLLDRVHGHPRLDLRIDVNVDTRIAGEGEEELADGDALHRDRPGLDRLSGSGPWHRGRCLHRGRDRGGLAIAGGRERCRAAAGEKESDRGGREEPKTGGRACARRRLRSARYALCGSPAAHVSSTSTEPEFCERAGGPRQGRSAWLCGENGPPFVGVGADGRRHFAPSAPLRALRD